MRINLREEETTNFLGFYRDYLETIQQLNKKVTDLLNDIMQESRYDKLQQRISQIIDTYSETIIGGVENGIFVTWVESKGSLRSCLNTYKAGESADEVCAQIEQTMGDLMVDILRIEKADVIVTERPIVSEDGLEQLEDAFRTAIIEIQDIKSEYVAQTNNRSEENEIFGTLRPLFEGIASNLESFFEASQNSFEEFHEFVRGISLQLHNIAEENGVRDSSGTRSTSESRIAKQLSSALKTAALSMGDVADSSSFDQFKEITNILYGAINNDATNKRKKVPYEAIIMIMPIYHKFYSEFGELLKDRFKTNDEREEYVKREYIGVTRERKNDQYFEGEEAWTFKSHAHHTYTVFDRVADMERNIAIACKNGTANDINLLYGAYVLFNPILEGYIDRQDEDQYSEFSIWASEEILRILGIERNDESSDRMEVEDGGIVFEGDNFTEDNIKLFVVVVERIVNQVGVDELNSSVEKHYKVLCDRRNTYSEKANKGASSECKLDLNTYGRYTVTRKSIQRMAPICSRVDSILEPIDKFYKEKFKSLGDGFDKANTVIHAISSFCAKWGLGIINLSDEGITPEDSIESILNKIQLGGVALATITSPTTGALLHGGALMLNVLDKAMPYLKKSKLLVRLSEKVWSLTKQDIQIPYVQKWMDQYMMEHYELKYGVSNALSPYFVYLHSVAMSIVEDYQRRAFENAVFAAEITLTPPYYTINEVDPAKKKAIYYGAALNLVRSGMCSKQEIESGTANEIVDKLYNIYISKERVTPRVDINPDQRILR